MSMIKEPVLDRPGAGLPAPELWIARILFAHRIRSGSRDAFVSRFQKERARIRVLVSNSPMESRSERVLIPRLRGLEDSSRYWSIWMTLDHLRITNEAFTMVIGELTAGKIPPGKADTAAVKPDPQVGEEIESAFEASCDSYLAVVDGAEDLRTSLRFEHPWFGPLDAFGWVGLAATHMGIHRAQIERIGKRLA